MAADENNAKRRKMEDENEMEVSDTNVLDIHLKRSFDISTVPLKFVDNTETAFIDIACKKYREFAVIPKSVSARIVDVRYNDKNAIYSILGEYSQQDLVNKQKIKYEKSATVEVNWETGIIQVDNSPYPSQFQDIIIQNISKDGKFRAIIRKLVKNEKTKLIIEIWSKGFFHKAIDVSAFDLHGDVYNDVTLASLQWSHDCQRVAYIAEKKKDKLSSFFDQDCNGCSNTDKSSIKGEQFVYEEDWGEQKNGLCNPVVVICDVVNEKLNVLANIPSYLSPGQLVWNSNDTIIFVGWWNNPFKLGLVYCENRRSAIFQAKINGAESDCIQLSGDHCSVHSPRVSPDRSKVVFLERDEGGPHRGCERLMMCDLKSKAKCSVVYNIVQLASDFQIPIFATSLIENCWAQNGQTIIFNTNYKSNQIIAMIEIETGKIKRITFEDGCWTLHDVFNDVLLASFSSPNTPDQLMIGKLSESKNVQWFSLNYKGSSYQSLKEKIKWEKFCVDAADGTSMESLLVHPIASSILQPPLIVWPHGGPHTCSIASFSHYITSFASIGFAVLLVNYRGSTGSGEVPLRSLLGKIGSQDVQDVQRIAEDALKTGKFDKRNIFAFGGSHGGFLSAHLIGKYPDFYRACALRNPVINLPAMVEVTDIPDWCYSESGFKYEHSNLPTKESYCRMLEQSPISFANQVNCPVLVLIGAKDCRVPPYQGRSFYRALKSMGKNVKMHWYPEDSHPLNQTGTEADVFINIVKWFYTHFQAH